MTIFNKVIILYLTVCYFYPILGLGDEFYVQYFLAIKFLSKTLIQIE